MGLMIVTKFSKHVVTWVLFSLFLRNIPSHFCDTCPFGKISVKPTRTAEQPQLELFFIAYMPCWPFTESINTGHCDTSIFPNSKKSASQGPQLQLCSTVQWGCIWAVCVQLSAQCLPKSQYDSTHSASLHLWTQLNNMTLSCVFLNPRGAQRVGTAIYAELWFRGLAPSS